MPRPAWTNYTLKAVTEDAKLITFNVCSLCEALESTFMSVSEVMAIVIKATIE